MSTDRKYPQYCGKRDKFEIHSDGKFFRITFYSNDRFDKTGFRALYDFESKIALTENTSVESYIACSSWKCCGFLNVYLFTSFYMAFKNVF